MKNYTNFLSSKCATVNPVGFDIPKDAIHPLLYEWQKVLVQWAVRKGRSALFCDCGLGKTFMQIIWAFHIHLHTSRDILIVAPLSVTRQTILEGVKLGITIHPCRSQSDVKPGINITNYEMLDHFDPSHFIGVILDESSILKSLDGKMKEKLIEMFAQTPYRLCCTATPAPNDITEIANHAEFLGIMSRKDMLAMFFVHDSSTSAHGGWRLKGHAEEQFYRWMASWSMSIRKPSDLNFDDTGYVLPSLSVEPVIVETGYAPDDQLFYTGLKGIVDRYRARKSTVKDRVHKAVELVQQNDEQWILWCGRNDEQDMLASLLKSECVSVPGSLTADEKERRIERWIDGNARILISKPSVLGFGMNFQQCHNMAFVGIGDSWESYYQCLRRCFRYGQKHQVNASIIISDIEQEVYANVMRKEQEATTMSQRLIEHVQQFEQEEIASVKNRDDYTTTMIQNEHYTLMLGDSCERMAELTDNSIDLTVSSIPFSNIYTYSPSERDLGNSRNDQEFYQHLGYIIEQLIRITKPGRDCCIHVQQIAASLVNDGFIGLKDFRGDVIRAFVERGWIYHGEVTIQKNPQSQAVRTKAKGLLFVQLHKDSSWMRPGFADYILIFRKPGENAIPILPDLTNEEWIQWAHPVWYDIRESDTLNVGEGRDAKDERHICPLQLGTIERCIRLWSNPGETIFDPFAGLGSTGYVAIKHNRTFCGIELKSSYFQAATKNLERAVRSRTQTTLFDLLPTEEEDTGHTNGHVDVEAREQEEMGV